MGHPSAWEADEVQWIKRAQGGDHEAFGFLVERHKQRVFSHVFRLVRRREDVEDIAQEIFFKAFRAIRSYNFQSTFAAWLRRVAVNHCFDYLRKERASRITYTGEVLEGGLNPYAEGFEVGSLNPEQQAVVRDLVERLLMRAPAEDRVILSLKELEGLSVEEIAEILNLNVGTVKVRLHRARKRMLADFRKWAKGK